MDQEFELYTPAASGKKTTDKNYPAVKIIAMILGIISAGLFIYYAADFTNQYIQQIAMVKEMGQPIDAATLGVIYFQIGLTFLVGVLPLIGAVLPGKCARTSILLIASSISWGIVNALPSVVIAFVQGATIKDVLTLVITCAAGLVALIAAILHAVIPAYEKKADEIVTYAVEADDIAEDAEEIEVSETAEEIVEEAVEEAVEETVEEVVEEVSEATEEVSEETEA